MKHTSIEWADSTWNPIRGCSRVSEGCRNCYAERYSHRFSGPGQPYEGLAHIVNGHAAWTGKVMLAENHLLDPLKWKNAFDSFAIPDAKLVAHRGRPRRIFVNSMSDLFHESVPDEWIDKIFAVMALCPQHTFQILTKRPERMREYLSDTDLALTLYDEIIDMADWNHSPQETVALTTKALKRTGERVNGGWHPLTGKDSFYYMPKIDRWPLPNVWMGVSVENQETADERISVLLKTPAAKRFISAEPLLGPVDLTELPSASGIGRYLNALSNAGDPGALVPHALDWVIVGGESGPEARPMHPDWVRSLRDQCMDAQVSFFFKQWGEWLGAMQEGANLETGQALNCTDQPIRVGKHKAGALLDCREWREFPGTEAQP